MVTGFLIKISIKNQFIFCILITTIKEENHDVRERVTINKYIVHYTHVSPFCYIA